MARNLRLVGRENDKYLSNRVQLSHPPPIYDAIRAVSLVKCALRVNMDNTDGLAHMDSNLLCAFSFRS